MGNLAAQIERTIAIKNDFKAVITGLGGTVPAGTPFREYPDKIRSIYTEQLHAYGYEVDRSSSSSATTRIDPAGLGKLLPIQNKIRRYVESHIGQFLYWLHPEDSTKKADGSPAVIDGSIGNEMLYIPGYYRKITPNFPKIRYMYSEYPLPGYTYVEPMSVAPWYSTYDNINNRAATVCSILFNADGSIQRDPVTDLLVYAANAAQFRGGNNSPANDALYNSFLGVARTSVNRTDINAKCAAAGNSHNGNYAAMLRLAELYTLEYANNNAQLTYNPALDANGYKQGGLGNGPAVSGTEWNTHNGYNPFVPGGVTAKLGNKTGVVNYKIKNWANTGVDKTVPVSSYRGLENWYEYLWLICSDAYLYQQTAVEGGKRLLYVASDPSKFTLPANDILPNAPDGYVLRSSDVATDGWGAYTVLTDYNDFLPAAVGASPTTGLCDYFYRSGDGWYQLLLVGGANFGTVAGPRCTDSSSRPAGSHARYGFRQSRFNPIVG